MLDLFGLVEAGWLVGFQFSSGAGTFPLCVIVLFVSGLTPLVRAEEETGFCCLHCKKGSYDVFCVMVVEIRNKMVVPLYQRPSSHRSSVAGSLTPSRW